MNNVTIRNQNSGALDATWICLALVMITIAAFWQLKDCGHRGSLMTSSMYMKTLIYNPA